MTNTNTAIKKSNRHDMPSTSKGVRKLSNQQNQTLSFECWFKILKKYKKKNGHTDVKFKYITDKGDGYRLGRWVSNIRSAYRDKMLGKRKANIKLTEAYIWKLQDIGFDFQHDFEDHPMAEEFHINLEKLAQFKMKHGHMNVSDSVLEEWVA